MKLPITTLPDVLPPWISTPLPRLPEMVLGLAALPIVLAVAPASMSKPLAVLPRLTPVELVPMKLPKSTFPDEPLPVISTPTELPEMMFPTRPPTVLAVAPVSRSTPAPLPSLVVPWTSVPR